MEAAWKLPTTDVLVITVIMIGITALMPAAATTAYTTAIAITRSMATETGEIKAIPEEELPNRKRVAE
jgi:hypothetical protein